MLDQIQFQVKTAVNDGSSKISIQLNPPELGKVDVKLNISADGKTSGITITADNQSTLNLLKQDTQGLTRALNDAGLSTDSGSLNFRSAAASRIRPRAQPAGGKHLPAGATGGRRPHRHRHDQKLRRQSDGGTGYYYLKKETMYEHQRR